MLIISQGNMTFIEILQANYCFLRKTTYVYIYK